MPGSPPIIYLLHGEDEYAIAQFLGDLEAKLGDPSSVTMNLTQLEGRSCTPEQLLSVAAAMPFLAKRRLVVLSNPLAGINSPTARQKFLEVLEKIPSTTALVLVEYRLLTEERDRRKGNIHWLEKWAGEAGERVYQRIFSLPKGVDLSRRIQELARKAGGDITSKAANDLAAMVSGDLRLADQELQKLLAYVNYSRSIDADDVRAITADSFQGDIFAMVDALAMKKGKLAMDMLQRLLEQQEPTYIFVMVVRQFRLLILAREVLDGGGDKGEVARQLKIHPYVAEKMSAQAIHFTQSKLDAIYRYLLDIDEAIKKGRIPGDLALEMLVAGFVSG